MMKKKFISGPLLLLLMLNMTPRYSYGNPISTLESSATKLLDEVDAEIEVLHLGDSTEILNNRSTILERVLKSSPIQYIMHTADIFLAVINYLKDEIGHTNYDEVIRQLEREVRNLPKDLNEDKKMMLLRLYKSKNRIITTKIGLEEATRQLASYCQDLIDIYEKKDPSMSLIKYTANEFVKYANLVRNLLDRALETYKETQDELSEARVSLTLFQDKLKAKKEELVVNGRKKRAIGDRNKRDVLSVLAAIFGLGIATFGIAKAVHYHMTPTDYSELIGRIEMVNETLNNLFNKNGNIQSYLVQEITLINKLQVKLDVSVLDHTELSLEDMKFAIEIFKRRLGDLIKACNDYLKHELLDILKKTDTPSHLIDNQTTIPNIDIGNQSAIPRIETLSLNEID